MKLSEQIKNDKSTYQRLDKNKRWLFIWDYYKLPIISVAVGLVLLVTIIVNIKWIDTALYVVLVNSNSEVQSTVISDLMENAGAQVSDREVEVETGYTLQYDTPTETDVQTLQVLAVRFGISDMDVFAADEPVFKSYANKDAFIDLSLFIPKELLNSHDSDLYRYKNKDGHEIVGGVWLREGSPLHKAGYYSGDVLIGVVSNAENLDNAILLVQQILK